MQPTAAFALVQFEREAPALETAQDIQGWRDSMHQLKGTSKNPHFIPTAALRKKFLAYISHMRRGEIFSAPCIWANSEFLEVP